MIQLSKRPSKNSRKKVTVMTIEELSKLTKEGFEQIQRQFEEVNRQLGALETDVAWIKGKLEGTQEGKASVWEIITIATAVGAVIIALIALLK